MNLKCVVLGVRWEDLSEGQSGNTCQSNERPTAGDVCKRRDQESSNEVDCNLLKIGNHLYVFLSDMKMII